jgi:NarL family two-component system response regulator LiaR
MGDIKRIVIIEDRPLLRGGLAAYFAGTGRWRVMGTAPSLEMAKEVLTRADTDVALLDIQLEDGWGLDIIPWLSQSKIVPQTKSTEQKAALPVFAVYSAFDDNAHVNAALSMGVRAYVCKRSNVPELEKAILSALEGKVYIDGRVESSLKKGKDVYGLLTKREREIFTLVKSGLSNKQIAARLGISCHTVENIMCCVYDKTGIDSRLELHKL